MPAVIPFSQDTADEICDRIAAGESLRKICDTPGFPSASTICKWLEYTPEMQKQYARARDIQAEYYVDQIIEIADSARDSDSAQAARVRIDSRKWIASKLKPKRYGDKLDVEHTGDINVNVVAYAKRDDPASV